MNGFESLGATEVRERRSDRRRPAALRRRLALTAASRRPCAAGFLECRDLWQPNEHGEASSRHPQVGCRPSRHPQVGYRDDLLIARSPFSSHPCPLPCAAGFLEPSWPLCSSFTASCKPSCLAPQAASSRATAGALRQRLPRAQRGCVSLTVPRPTRRLDARVDIDSGDPATHRWPALEPLLSHHPLPTGGEERAGQWARSTGVRATGRRPIGEAARRRGRRRARRRRRQEVGR